MTLTLSPNEILARKIAFLHPDMAPISAEDTRYIAFSAQHLANCRALLVSLKKAHIIDPRNMRGVEFYSEDEFGTRVVDHGDMTRNITDALAPEIDAVSNIKLTSACVRFIPLSAEHRQEADAYIEDGRLYLSRSRLSENIVDALVSEKLEKEDHWVGRLSPLIGEASCLVDDLLVAVGRAFDKATRRYFETGNADFRAAAAELFTITGQTFNESGINNFIPRPVFDQYVARNIAMQLKT